MKFVLSYSGGKDSVLALHKMLEAGHEPVGLLVMVNRDLQRSWFHGVDLNLLQVISDSLGIPLLLCECSGEEYGSKIEEGLRKAKAQGAEACVFGDIDIGGHLLWCRQRCDAAGLECIHPLWHRSREENTEELLSLGYRCLIKCIDNRVLSKDFLGKELSSEWTVKLKERGVDVCGENGEYHTLVVDGPIFRYPIPCVCREILDFGATSAVNICIE